MLKITVHLIITQLSCESIQYKFQIDMFYGWLPLLILSWYEMIKIDFVV